MGKHHSQTRKSENENENQKQVPLDELVEERAWIGKGKIGHQKRVHVSHI
jgi:hypothetical protein